MSLVTLDIQKAFFDRRKIENQVDRAAKGALSKAGASVRREQRGLIKRRKSRSKPGNPPHAHRKGLYSPKTILFGYDRRSQSVVVGMVKLAKSSVKGATPYPELMEKGGTARIRSRKSRRRVKIAKRPSAKPALRLSIDRGDVIQPWENILEP